MKKIIVLAIAASCMGVACTPKASPAKTSEIMPAVVSTNSADIVAGQSIFTNQCTKCHTAKTSYVNNHTYEEAKPVIAAMTQKSKLNDQEIKQLAAYVNSIAKK